MQDTSRTTAVAASFLIAGAIPVAVTVVAHTIAPDWGGQQYSLHALFGGLGAFAALTLAVQLRTLRVYERGEACHVWIASALIALGLLDAVHGACRQDELIIWLQVTATLAGGLLFACVWLPDRIAYKSGASLLPLVVLAAAAIHGTASIARPDWLPVVLEADAITGLASLFNLLGSAGFLVAACYFCRTYWRGRSLDHLVLFNLCLLFSAAGLLIQFATLWNGAWWISHIVRLAAYGIAVLYFFRLYLKDQHELRESHRQLEQRVEERTAELRDEIEQRTQAEQRIQRHADELQRSNEDLEEFAYMAAHDLQAPLRAVNGFCGLLKEKYAEQLDETANNYIGRAVAGAKRMHELLDGLLTYSRVQSRANEPEKTDCMDVLKRAMANLQMDISESEALITHDELPTVEFDSTQMEQLLQNLIGNAVKFRGECPVKIHVSADNGEREWVISVRDNGIGIDPGQSERVFGVFQRLHTAEKYPGTGIGLAVCKRIVERHGGRIWLESQLGSGCAFHFTVPRT